MLRGEVVAHAFRSAHADGRERSLKQNIAAPAGWPDRRYGDRPVLIVHGDPPANRVQRDSGERRLHAGVALYISCGDRAIGVLHCQIAVNTLYGDATKTGFGKSISAYIRERDGPVPRNRANSLRDIRGFDGSKR